MSAEYIPPQETARHIQALYTSKVGLPGAIGLVVFGLLGASIAVSIVCQIVGAIVEAIAGSTGSFGL